MKFDFDIRWLVNNHNEELDQRLLSLLIKINESGSLQIAANLTGVSYRTAWSIIRYWNEVFGMPLCHMERGRGTKLTVLGERLLQAKYLIDTEYSERLEHTASDLNNEINKLIGVGKHKKDLNAYTSHDLAIDLLQSFCDESTELKIEFHSQGSLDNLKLLNSSQTDIAGFHFPEGSLASETLASKYKQWLDDEKHILIHLTLREQGLMIKPSLTGHITSLKSLTRRSIKFVNRQKGSGTRTTFDELIKINGINNKDINGYEKEEFTHTAVAALISSGHADVGFGLKAAAIQFNLSFLPMLTESYVIAINKSLPKEIIKEIRLLIKNQKLKNKISKLPGYNTKLTGKLIHANKLLSQTK